MHGIHTFLSPAKINIFLRVLGRREDGYHNIVSLMQPISLYDEIGLEISDGNGVSVECSGNTVPLDKTNLACAAAEAYFRATGINKRLHIKIKKNIPVAAGLGGGSSNAATILKALNKIISPNISTGTLAKIGEGIGSDVPFFIACTTSIARGRGELLEPVQFPALWYILINPGFPVSAEWAYQNLNLTKKQQDINIPLLKVLPAGAREIRGIMKNDLEEVAIKKYPEIKEIKSALIGYGAMGALMSGSGPTVFGAFPDRDKAGDALESVRRDPGFKEMAVFMAQGL